VTQTGRSNTSLLEKKPCEIGQHLIFLPFLFTKESVYHLKKNSLYLKSFTRSWDNVCTLDQQKTLPFGFWMLGDKDIRSKLEKNMGPRISRIVAKCSDQQANVCVSKSCLMQIFTS